MLQCENPIKLEDQWIEEYSLSKGDFDIQNVDMELLQNIPSATQRGKVYKRLILDTLLKDESYVDGKIRVYNNPICNIIDNYNSNAYYEPSYVIARAYNEGGFQENNHKTNSSGYPYFLRNSYHLERSYLHEKCSKSPHLFHVR